MHEIAVTAKVNGKSVSYSCDPATSLLECLRDNLLLKGPKIGCLDGNCGACAVILDGRVVNSCLVLGAEAEGREIVTVEGLESWPGFAALRQAFTEEDGLQCGYCTPGIVIAAKALLDRDPDPSPERIRDWLAGNLCRCTGYETIVRAVQSAASALRGTGDGAGKAVSREVGA